MLIWCTYFLLLLYSPVVTPIAVHPTTDPHPIPPPTCLQEDGHPTPARPPTPGGSQVSRRLGISSLTEARSGSSLLYMFWW